jgi:hypothetical protein
MKKIPILAFAALLLAVGVTVAVITGKQQSPDESTSAAVDTRDTDVSRHGLRAAHALRGETRDAGSEDNVGRILTPTAAQAEEDESALGLVDGRVIDWATGEGVEGAELTLSREGAVVAALSTTAGGGFRYAPQSVEPVNVVSVTADGYLPYAPEWGHSPVVLSPSPHWHVTGVVIYMTPAIDYVAFVVDPDNRPVGGAEVRIAYLPAGEQQLFGLESHFETDERGEVVFHAPDNAVLEAAKKVTRGDEPRSTSPPRSLTACASRSVLLRTSPRRSRASLAESLMHPAPPWLAPWSALSHVACRRMRRARRAREDGRYLTRRVTLPSRISTGATTS